MSKKMRAIAKNSTKEKNIIVHHSIFISLMLYYAKLNEIYQCSNLLDLRSKINNDLHASPKNTYEKCLYILSNALARYRLKNLELLYLTVGTEKGIHNLQICDYNYIKKNDLYLSKSINIRQTASVTDKIKNVYNLIVNRPQQLSFFHNLKDIINLATEKDTIKKKNIRLYIHDNDNEYTTGAIKKSKHTSIWSLITLPLQWIRSLHSYDDCL